MLTFFLRTQWSLTCAHDAICADALPSHAHGIDVISVATRMFALCVKRHTQQSIASLRFIPPSKKKKMINKKKRRKRIGAKDVL